MAGLEGGHTLGASLAVLRSMYLLGIRFVSLTGFACTTPWAGAAAPKGDIVLESHPQGLTEFGELVIIEMNRIGMLIEISKMSQQGILMTLHFAKSPVLLSNTAPASFCNGSVSSSVPDHILG